ncbi:heme d1 biosynthesis radical SAM protein NirJ [Aliikangiella sp. IMCC44359]|uniref:heme d1 biosynthesis radical SAM protein NirJ n=1 Tax=Aliikangiella sp. IMCC44359 TaxID=3459125 RepID=UPI00403ABDA8
MFRVTQFMQAVAHPNKTSPLRKPKGPVVIWNLIRRCNLCCKHCYSISADTDFPGELNTQQVFDTLDDLKSFHVPALILSGGEPLLRKDIFDIAAKAKELGFYIGLSTNGTLINEANIDEIAQAKFDYLGISIDGIEKTHDKFRQMEGAFSQSMHAIKLCQERGIKVGLRFTLTQDNAKELPEILNLIDQHKIDKFYLSHLNYAGRGNRNRKDDVVHQMTKQAMDLIFDEAWKRLGTENEIEFVTGNNDADGVYFLQWVKHQFPEKASFIEERLKQWGGNSTGKNVANIDNLGEVHPDTFWWDYKLGNVKTRKFSEIWCDVSDPLMAGLKMSERPLKGRCGLCEYKTICGGNTRVRAYQLTGDPWQEDPACYLSDEELNIKNLASRIEVVPFQRKLSTKSKTPML